MRLSILSVLSSLVIAGMPLAALGQTAAGKMHTDIPAEALAPALRSLAQELGFQIVYASKDVAALRTRGAKGEFTADEALTAVLNGTGMTFRHLDEHTITVIPVARDPAQPAASKGTEDPAGAPTDPPKEDAQPVSTAAPASSASDSQPLQAVIITAQKRKQTFLDAPVIATVLTQQSLEQSKIESLKALASQVPSLLLGDSINSTGTQLSLRGVGTMALNATMDQSVLLDVDGVPLSQSLAYSMALFDVAELQVYEGPQALFFGKNSTAGVISLESADPTDKVERVVNVAYETNAQEKQFDLILSGPLSDTLKLRLAARYDTQEGYFHNHAVAIPDTGTVTPTYSNFAPSQTFIVRGTALYQPTDRLTARVKLSYSDNRTQAGSPLEVAYCPDGTSPLPPININFLAGEPCQLSRNIYVPWFDPAAFPGGMLNGGAPFASTTVGLGSLDLRYQLAPNLTLTSVTGYYGNNFEMLQTGSTSSTVQVISAINHFQNRQFTQELRLASADAERPLNYLVGAFFNHGDMLNDIFVGGNVLLGLPPSVQHPVFTVDNLSYSLFGQLIWDITSQWQISGGARWTHEDRSLTEVNQGPLQGPIGVVAVADPTLSSSNVSPQVTVLYKPTKELSAYATFKTGNKSGSFNALSFVPANQSTDFHDERARGGELGLKALTDGGRLRAEMAYYYYRYLGLQVGALVTPSAQFGPPVPFEQTVNAASAIVKGVDFDVSYAPAILSGLTLSGAVNYNSARYSSFPNAPCGNGQTIGEGCNQLLNPVTGLYTAQDLAGRPLVRAPDWSASFGLSRATPLPDDMVLDVGVDGNYVSEYSTVVPDLPGFVQKGYVKIDASISLSGHDDAWEAALIGRNLNNRITTAWCANAGLRNSIFGGQVAGGTTSGPVGRDDATCDAERGREVWGRVTLRF